MQRKHCVLNPRSSDGVTRGSMRLRLGFTVCVVLSVFTFFASAKSPSAPSKPAPETRVIGLQDAVRLTLRRSPRIKLQGQDAEARRGELLVRSGAFDTRVAGNGSHGT